MEDKSKPLNGGDSGSQAKSVTDLDGAEDGRNKEWEDRARVNLEDVSDGTKTNIERDFEPELPGGKEKRKDDNEVY